MNKFITIAIIVILLVLGGAGYYYFTTGVKKGTVVFNADPKNSTYTIEDRQITLINGESNSGSNTTSLDYYDAILENITQTADVDGDGVPETLVVISYNGGGSGVFSYLAVVKAGLESMPTLFIGDRLIIQNIKVVDGIISVNYLDRAPTDAMAEMPTIPQILRAKLINNQLTNLDGQ